MNINKRIVSDSVLFWFSPGLLLWKPVPEARIPVCSGGEQQEKKRRAELKVTSRASSSSFSSSSVPRADRLSLSGRETGLSAWFCSAVSAPVSPPWGTAAWRTWSRWSTSCRTPSPPSDRTPAWTSRRSQWWGGRARARARCWRTSWASESACLSVRGSRPADGRPADPLNKSTAATRWGYKYSRGAI